LQQNRLKADLPTTAFRYLAVIALLSLIASYFVSVVLTILSVAATIRRREMAPKPGLAAAANSSIMVPEPIASSTGYFPSSENLPVPPEIFPATRLKILCSAAQGIWLRAIDFAR
jgi:hypothetical protein